MSTPAVPKQFRGYACHSASTWSTLTPHTFTPKVLAPWDITIAINYCGICGSDLHVLRSGWSPTIYPVVAGHEITGRVVETGSSVTSINIGDLVGVGAQAWSCGGCDACAGEEEGVKVGKEWGPEGEHGYGGKGGLQGGRENYCREVCETYNWRYKTGELAYGGYADYCRVHENFVYPIPAGVSEEIVAPMLCGGVTMYSPLKRANIGPGSHIGIVGLGGLGHFGVLFAKALGARVTVISHSTRKQADALALGASSFITTSSADWNLPHLRSLDLIISTNFSSDMPLGLYLSLLKLGGELVVCGIPEGNLPAIAWGDLAGGNLAIRGSNVGSKKEVLEMLQLVKEKDVKSWVQVRPMREVGECVQALERGEARYRIVLKADWEDGGKENVKN